MRSVAVMMLIPIAAFRVVAADVSPLRLVCTSPLPKIQGRFDHFSMDTKGSRLFVAALGNNTLEVLDVAGFRRLNSIAGLKKPTGVLYQEGASRLHVANGDDGTLRTYDAATF